MTVLSILVSRMERVIREDHTLLLLSYLDSDNVIAIHDGHVNLIIGTNQLVRQPNPTYLIHGSDKERERGEEFDVERARSNTKFIIISEFSFRSGSNHKLPVFYGEVNMKTLGIVPYCLENNIIRV